MKKTESESKETVLITGAAGGMGSAAVKKFSSEGCRVFGLDISEPESTDGFDFIKTDLTDGDSLNAAAAKLKASGEKLDCIINMAGMYDLNSLVEMDETDFKRIFDVNLFSDYRVNKAFLPLLKPNGRIIIVSSELAPLDPLPFTGIYAITKTAVEQYAYSLRMELQLLGHRVILIRPGAVDTGLLDVSTKRLDDFIDNTKLYRCNAERFKSIVGRVEARKVPPEKIAALASRAARAKHPKYVYKINRNPLLLIMNALPDRLQNTIIRRILKNRGK